MNYRIGFIRNTAIILSFLLSACVLPPRNEYADVPVMDGTLHITQEGETLSAVAQAYEVSVPLIRRVNNVSEIGSLKKGTRLFIPGAVEPKLVVVNSEVDTSQKPDGLYHPVAAGETLSAIAKAYEITMTEIQEINNLYDPNELRAGDQLWIPRAKEVQDVSIPTVTIASAEPVPTPSQEPRVTIEVKPTPKPTKAAPAKSAEKEYEFPRAIKRIEDLKFQWPIKENKFKILQEFNESKLDYSIVLGTELDEPVYSVADGVVEAVGNLSDGPYPKDKIDLRPQYGNHIIISHGLVNNKPLRTIYAHNKENKVALNQKVKRGEQIAVAGTTSYSNPVEGAVLQFQIRDLIDALDPMDYLPAFQ